MLDVLKSLIFGLKEYEKARIDDRVNHVISIMLSIQLKTLEDFEILEECIYKLKEQLRVRSSNLNRVIRDSSFDVNKKKVVDMIENLESIRYNFLKKMFSIVESNFSPNLPQQEIREEHSSLEKELVQNNSNEDIHVETSKQEKVVETPSMLKKDIEDILVFEDDLNKIFLNSGKVPYLLIEFKEELNFVLLKNLSSHLFENYECHGTNILVEDKRALIVPRFIGDNLIELPKVGSNLDEVFEKLKSNKSNVSELKSEFKEETSKENLNDEKKTKVVDINKLESLKSEVKDDFVELDETSKKQDFKTRKKEEDSLDELLSGVVAKEDHKKKKIETEKQKDEKRKDKPKRDEKDDKIEIEHERKFSGNKKSEFEVELKTFEDKLVEENVALQGSIPFEIYKDEKIVAYFKHDSKILGEIQVTMAQDGKSISDLNESDLSYISIFSKVFAGVLFELVGAHGTNILWSFNDNSIRIIPRAQDDNIDFKVNGEQAKPEFLEQVRQRLLTEMQKEIKHEKGAVKEADFSEKPIEIKETSEEDMSERAKYILNSLKRIP